MSKKVFFSYSTDDDDLKLLEELKPYFIAFSNKGLMEIVDKNKLQDFASGTTRSAKEEVSKSDLAVQFISVNYMGDTGSDGCMDLLGVAEQNKVKILPVLLRSCLWEEDVHLKKLASDFFPDNKTPVADMTRDLAARDTVFTKLAFKVKEYTFPELKTVNIKKGSTLFYKILTLLILILGTLAAFYIRSEEELNNPFLIGIVIFMTLLICLITLRGVLFPTNYSFQTE